MEYAESSFRTHASRESGNVSTSTHYRSDCLSRGSTQLAAKDCDLPFTERYIHSIVHYKYVTPTMSSCEGVYTFLKQEIQIDFSM